MRGILWPYSIGDYCNFEGLDKESLLQTKVSAVNLQEMTFYHFFGDQPCFVESKYTDELKIRVIVPKLPMKTFFSFGDQ